MSTCGYRLSFCLMHTSWGQRQMQSVRDIAEGIVAREGGYVNDPDDPGGAEPKRLKGR